MFQRIHDVLSHMSRVAAWAGGAALMLCAVMITGDVLCRKFFGISIGGSDEITGYVFAGATTWAYAYCLLHRANIRIDALYNRFPRPMRAAIDVISVLLLLIFVAILTDHAYSTLSESIANNATSITPLTTPMWIPQTFWVIGWVFFLVTLVFVLIHLVKALLSRDLDAIGRIAGLRSVEEEIVEETRGTGATPHSEARDDRC
jgi:TRAP-type C4-dicarboxylate transport system permease small subunit